MPFVGITYKFISQEFIIQMATVLSMCSVCKFSWKKMSDLNLDVQLIQENSTVIIEKFIHFKKFSRFFTQEIIPSFGITHLKKEAYCYSSEIYCYSFRILWNKYIIFSLINLVMEKNESLKFSTYLKRFLFFNFFFKLLIFMVLYF